LVMVNASFCSGVSRPIFKVAVASIASCERRPG
jgi:hypothetical protein